MRSRSGWRTYGPDQIARLHQILALKQLGLSLASIGQLFACADTLDGVLALQDQALVQESRRIARGRALIRAARAKLGTGQALSIDDLATLSKETSMTSKLTRPTLFHHVPQPKDSYVLTPALRAAGPHAVFGAILSVRATRVMTSCSSLNERLSLIHSLTVAKAGRHSATRFKDFWRIDLCPLYPRSHLRRKSALHYIFTARLSTPVAKTGFFYSRTSHSLAHTFGTKSIGAARLSDVRRDHACAVD